MAPAKEITIVKRRTQSNRYFPYSQTDRKSAGGDKIANAKAHMLTGIIEESLYAYASWMATGAKDTTIMPPVRQIEPTENKMNHLSRVVLNYVAGEAFVSSGSSNEF